MPQQVGALAQPNDPVALQQCGRREIRSSSYWLPLQACVVCQQHAGGSVFPSDNFSSTKIILDAVV